MPETDSLNVSAGPMADEKSSLPKAVPHEPAELVEAKARRVASVTSRNNSLAAQVDEVKKRIDAVLSGLKYPAKTTVQNHIRLLHEYNEIKDVSQGLLGLLADQQNMRMIDLYEQYDISPQD